MAVDYEQYVPSSQESLYQRELARLMPDIRKQRAQQAQALQTQMQRMGTVNPQLTALQSIEPWAQAMGQAGATAASTAERLAQQEKEYAAKINLAREQTAIQQQQFAQQLEEQMKARQQQAMLQLFQYTGFSPELLKQSGLESLLGGFGGAGDWNRFQRQLGRYNLPGQPFSPMGGGFGYSGLTASQQMALSKFYPGSSRYYKEQAARNWGWL